MEVAGTLIARGTVDNPIRFTSNQNEPAKGDWSGIHLTETGTDANFDEQGNYLSGSVIQHAVIEYGGGAEAYSSVIYAAVALYVDHVTFQQNELSQIRVSLGIGDSGHSIYVTNNEFSGNGSEGFTPEYAVNIDFREHPTVIDVTGNTFTENTHGAVNIVHPFRTGTDSYVNFAENNITANVSRGEMVNMVLRSPTVITTISGNNIVGNTSTTVASIIGRSDITNNIFSRNDAGSVIETHSSTRISNNEITYNSGSGIAVYDAAVINANEIMDNYGGGVYLSSIAEDVEIHDNIFIRNTAKLGGAIYTDSVSGSYTLHVYNNTITENVAEKGGGIYQRGKPGEYTYIRNNNIHDNQADTGSNICMGKNLGWTGDLDAEGNYWGTTDPETIENSIWHFVDDSDLGKVDYTPFLTSPVVEEPPSSDDSSIYLPMITR
jgi:hypothetical protein